MIQRLTEEEIQNITSFEFQDITKEIQGEMAIPTYLHKNPLIRWLFWKRYEYIAELAILEKNKTVFEFGCGIGVFLPTLSNQSKEVYAVDLFPQYAEKLAEIKGIPVNFVKDISEIADGSLDLIIAADVLEHLDQPRQYLEIFKKKLKKNGTLIVSGPTENIFYRIGRFLAVRFKQLPDEFEELEVKAGHHLTNINQLKKIITDCGFALEGQKKLPFSVPPYLFKIFKFRIN